MKKLVLLSVLFLGTSLMSGCSTQVNKLTFESDMYTVKNGDKVTVKEKVKGVTYSFVGEVPQGVSLVDTEGLISFTDATYNYSQVLYQATYKNIKSNLVVLTLTHDVEIAELTFVNPTNYVIDGDYILANSSTDSAIKYEITNRPFGVEIDSSSGKLSFTEGCLDNQEVEVKISSKNATSVTKTFYTATTNLAVAKNYKQACEEDGSLTVSYYLDFSDVDTSYPHTVLGVMHNKKLLESTHYTFDENNSALILKPSFLNTLSIGENNISIITSRNNVNVELIKATKFIRTAEDLASIGDNQTTLKGYYILANDIDLTSYLSAGGKGYNEGRGWNPIGTYHDVTDGTATKDAFNGTFDGNGYTISGFYINRTDEKAYNAGVFGYVDFLGIIKNLTVRTATAGLSVRSFSGVIAGNNQGKIINCAVYGSITNYSGENLFKNLGLVCGTNGGEVHNVIGYGSVTGDAYFGALIGSNEGIASNLFSTKATCESLVGAGSIPENSVLFDTESALKQYDYSDILDETYWDVTPNSLPKTKQYLEYFSIYSIEIRENTTGYYIKGDKFNISVDIYPVNLRDDYIDLVTISVVGDGITYENNVVDTTNATINEFYISATLQVGDELYTDTVTYHLYDKVTAVELTEDTETTMNAGSSYRLKAIVTPASANQEVKYTLRSTYNGVTLTGDIVSIADSCTLSSFVVNVIAGSFSKAYTIKINKIKSLSQGTIVMYEGQLQDMVFNFSSTLSLEGIKAYIDNSLINIKEVQENAVVIAKEYIEKLPNTVLKFKFVLATGEMYSCQAVYFNRGAYDLEFVQANYTNYHLIEDFNDFATYFNILDSQEEGLGFSEAKYEYYDDVFVLTNDINFNNQKTYGIGTYDSDEGTGIMFEGKIFGQGYSIKNVRITDNEKWFINDDKTGNWRNSLYAVGFFKSFNGEMYDVIFDNCQVNSNNWVALFACSIESHGRLENVKFTNCKVTSTGGTQGKVYCTNNGANNLLAVSYNGETSNLGR